MPRCHYEVLGIPQTATPEEIKSSYRKLALVWHPDKNPHQIEEATSQFRDIQSAYEVLSDKNERSWYDSHRESILRGHQTDFSDSSHSQRPEDEINLWNYFSSSVFSGFGNSDNSFYGVYGKVFRDLSRQEQEAARKEGRRIPADAPDLGYSTFPYPQVNSFYNYWLSFASEKSFSWCDEYNLAAAPNRQIRRRMDDENKKLRKKEKKEFNEVVRSLAAFVKKRDKRVQEYQIQMQKEQKQKEEEMKRRKKMEAEKKVQRANAFIEQEWSRTEEGGESDDDAFYGWDEEAKERGRREKKKAARKEKDELEMQNGRERALEDEEKDIDYDDVDDADDVSELYCIVCNKKFKSQKQWMNHEKSKKHLERVYELRESLKEEDEYFEEKEEEEEEEEEDKEEAEEKEKLRMSNDGKMKGGKRNQVKINEIYDFDDENNNNNNNNNSNNNNEEEMSDVEKEGVTVEEADEKEEGSNEEDDDDDDEVEDEGEGEDDGDEYEQEEEEDEEVMLIRMMKAQRNKQKQSNPKSKNKKKQNENGTHGFSIKQNHLNVNIEKLNIDENDTVLEKFVKNGNEEGECEEEKEKEKEEEEEESMPNRRNGDRKKRQEKVKKKQMNLKKKHEMMYEGIYMGNGTKEKERKEKNENVEGEEETDEQERDEHDIEKDQIKLKENQIKKESKSKQGGVCDEEDGESGGSGGEQKRERRNGKFDEKGEGRERGEDEVRSNGSMDKKETLQSKKNENYRGDDDKTFSVRNMKEKNAMNAMKEKLFENINLEKKKKGKGRKGKVINENSCAVCGESFESRNVLFKHIQSSGHSVPKT